MSELNIWAERMNLESSFWLSTFIRILIVHDTFSCKISKFHLRCQILASSSIQSTIIFTVKLFQISVVFAASNKTINPASWLQHADKEYYYKQSDLELHFFRASATINSIQIVNVLDIHFNSQIN